MTDGELAYELQAIGGELEQLLENERDEAIKLERRFDEDHGAIERLLQSVQEAKAIGQWQNTRFNVFEVLGRTRREQAHSNLLAWLLDPAEAHGLGDAFLREFMAKAIGMELPSTDVTVTPEFHCGLRNCDIHVKGDRWCLVVETKIDDFPWPDQCGDYQEYCEKVEGRGEQAWLVYVTRPARRPSDSSIPWISYSEVRQILERLTPDPSTATLIENFCDHIVSDLEV
jgi:hypothetical protein